MKSDIFVSYGRLIFTLDGAAAGQLYLQGNGETRQWWERGMRRSFSPSWGASTLRTKEILWTWSWIRYVAPKRRFLQQPHGVLISQKTAHFIVTAGNNQLFHRISWFEINMQRALLFVRNLLNIVTWWVWPEKVFALLTAFTAYFYP
jgi:hypothetical protein